MPTPYFKNEPCHYCNKETKWILNIHVFANDTEHYAWTCSACNRVNPAGSQEMWLPHSKVESALNKTQLADLPRILPKISKSCSRCGKTVWVEKYSDGTGPKELICGDCKTQPSLF